MIQKGATQADAELAWTRKTTEKNERLRRERFKRLNQRRQMARNATA